MHFVDNCSMVCPNGPALRSLNSEANPSTCSWRTVPRIRGQTPDTRHQTLDAKTWSPPFAADPCRRFPSAAHLNPGMVIGPCLSGSRTRVDALWGLTCLFVIADENYVWGQIGEPGIVYELATAGRVLWLSPIHETGFNSTSMASSVSQ